MGIFQAFSFILLTVPIMTVKLEESFDLRSIDLSLTDILAPEDILVPRIEKSLANSFPFNVGQKEEDSYESHHGVSRAHSAPKPPRSNQARSNLIQGQFRQYGEIAEESSPTFTEVTEKKCIDKVMIVEETAFDEVITCDHSYDQRCHTSYVTAYDAVQEEDCEENYKKECFIEMKVIAFNETTEVCKKPLIKDCDIDGDTVCRTEYESECWTKQIPHEVEDDVAECQTVHQEMCKDQTVGYTTTKVCEDWPHEECQIQKRKITKYTPMTGCEKVPRELCAPAGCGFKQGPEECHPVTKTIVGEKPEETCTLQPQRTCKHVTKLVPKLVATEECVDVPKEVCTRSKTNPRKIKKPVVKKWCYIPSEESGLA